MKTKTKIKVAYVTYPYTNDPKGNSMRIKEIAQDIIKHRQDICLIVPHYAFDALLDFPKGYNNTFFARWELEVISRCDMVILPNIKMTCGMVWETEFAKRLGIPIHLYSTSKSLFFIKSVGV